VRYVVGVDLGQRIDYTAVCVVDRWEADTTVQGRLNVRAVERLPLGETYAEQCDQIQAIVNRLERQWGVMVVIDATGLGIPVMEIARARLNPTPFGITITSGDSAIKDRLDWRVPKHHIVGALQVVLQNRGLQIAPAATEAATLVNELKGFTQILNAGGAHYANDPIRAPHDDLVISLALAAYAAQFVSRAGAASDVVAYTEHLDGTSAVARYESAIDWNEDPWRSTGTSAGSSVRMS
jgi:hypothetical protein